jgi:hypothetical protein
MEKRKKEQEARKPEYGGLLRVLELMRKERELKKQKE